MVKATKRRVKRGITRRDFIKGTTTIGAAAAVASLGFPNILRGASPPEIVIGHLHPLSGPLALEGRELKNGTILAVKEINDAGGIKSLGGAKLKLLDADSEGKPQLAVSEVERLYRAGAVVVMGCFQTSVTLVATQTAEKFRLPFVVTIAVADEVTSRGLKYTFRIQHNADQLTTKQLQFMTDIFKASGEKVKTIAYLNENSSFGQAMKAYVVKKAPNFGLEVISDIPYNPQAADLSSEVGKAKAAGADTIWVSGYIADGIRLLRSMRDLRVKSKGIIGVANAAFSHYKFVEELGSLTEYIMDCNMRVDMNSPVTIKRLARYKETYGTEMVPWGMYAQAAVYVTADAIERAKSTDREAIREALTKTNMTDHGLPQGPIVFGPDGQNINAAPVLTQILGGKIVSVYPEQYAQAKWVFPHPAKF